MPGWPSPFRVYEGEDVNVRMVDVGPPGAPGIFASYILEYRRARGVVDPGPLAGAPTLAEAVGGAIDFIFVTHVHLDHVGGVGALWSAAGPVVYAHPRGVRHLRDPRKLWKASRAALGWLAASMGPPAPVPAAEPVEDGARVGGCTVIHTPGHAPHHASLDCGEVLFPGDSIAIALESSPEPVVVPTLMPPVDLDGFLSSLDRQEALEARVAALPHYGIWDAGSVIREARKGVDEWLKAARRACSGSTCTGLDVLREARALGGGAARAVEYAFSRSAALWLLLQVMADGLAAWARANG